MFRIRSCSQWLRSIADADPFARPELQVINTRGFTHVGRIVGLFRVSLLYAKVRTERRSATGIVLGRFSVHRSRVE
ncbi:hypothetical protein [Ilumatobacter sp.]|uniref:hypothetical protein n=1 Tax=Ilumatobacter sp. TaxID=1967498 RepID=UPI003752A919